jgi:di/tricarboxylate transporter
MRHLSQPAGLLPVPKRTVGSCGCPFTEPRSASPLRRRLTLLCAFAVVLLALAGGLVAKLMPGTLFERDAARVAAATIFVASYVALAIGRVPGLAIDRAGVALVGASLMVACGALPLDQAYQAVDLDTLTLLLGMMILVANLRLSGFFRLAAGWVMRRARRPLALLAAVAAVSGMFSAFLVNDAVCWYSHPWSSS